MYCQLLFGNRPYARGPSTKYGGLGSLWPEPDQMLGKELAAIAKRMALPEAAVRR